jgi:hypothetical protein
VITALIVVIVKSPAEMSVPGKKFADPAQSAVTA